MPLTIVFPIGGKGERFLKAGYTTPKPFIQFNGKAFLAHAINSYPRDNKFIFLIRPEYRISITYILSLYANISNDIIELPRETKGPLDTIISCNLEVEGEVLFADCDSAIRSKEIEDAIRLFHEVNADGGVTIRFTDDPICSYCIMDDERWVKATQEKNREFNVNGEIVTSRYSTTGPYWWKDFETFRQCAVEALQDGEYHISPTYNYLIQRKGRVKACPISTFRHFGTPEALKTLERSMQFEP